MENDRSATDKNKADEAGAITLLSGIGDRELWYAESERRIEDGDQGPVWRFPLYVDWKTDAGSGREYAMIHPALCPHHKAELTLRALFEPHDKLGKSGRWLVLKGVVPSVLKKAPGITREKYYRWDGKEERGIAYTETLTPGEREPEYMRTRYGQDRKLITQVAEACGLQSSVVKIVLDGLNKVAADLMVKQREPLDLGFVKLIAVPFRANWKEIVTFKLRKLGLLQCLKEDREHDVSYSNDESNPLGLPETLCSPHNVALRREKKKGEPLPVSRIDYSVEVLTSKKFEKEITALVTQARQAGHTAQVGHYEKTVEKLYDQIMEILRSYRKKIGLPFARICDSSRSGGLRFMETRGHLARAHGHNLRSIPVHICAPTHGFSATAEGQQELVCEAASQVPKLPAFSSTPEDLWQPAQLGAVGELGNGEGGDGGVPLLDAGEGSDAGQRLLPCSEAGRGPSRVDIIGD